MYIPIIYYLITDVTCFATPKQQFDDFIYRQPISSLLKLLLHTKKTNSMYLHGFTNFK